MSDDDKARSAASKEEAFEWLMRLTSGEATAEDAQALDRWRRQDPSHDAALIQVSTLWRSVGPAAKRAAARSGRSSALGSTPLLRSVTARRAVLGGAVAAAAAYVVVRPPLGLWPSVSELTSDYRTGTGEQRRIVAAGGASLELNTATSIDLRPMPDGADRVELIAGEIAVATAPRAAAALVVVAADGRASATDASFNVRYAAPSVCVTCLAGSVRIDYRGHAVILRERQQIAYADGVLDGLSTVDPGEVTSWRDGVLIFHNEPLARVIDEVNRYRPGRIIVTSSRLGERLVTARFKLARLQDVITQVQQVFGANVIRLPGGVVLLTA